MSNMMQAMQSNSFYCKITLLVSGDTAPNMSAKILNAASGTGNNILPKLPRWKEVAVPIL